MFDIQLSRDELVKVLKAVESTVGDTTGSMGEDCISITDTGNSTIEVYTTNSIEFSCVSMVITSGSAGTIEKMPCVNFKRFKKIIESIPEGEFISIKSNVNDIEINYGTKKKPIKLMGSSVAMMAIKEPGNGLELTVDSQILETGLRNTCAIIKQDPKSPPAITDCMKVSTNGLDVNITALDIKYNRMFIGKYKNTNISNGDIIIEPNKLLKAFELFKMVESDVLTIESDGNITKIYGDVVASTDVTAVSYYFRNMNGTFPNVTIPINTVNEYAIVNKDEMKASLTRIDAIEDTNTNVGVMELEINNDFVNVVKKSQYGIVEDSFGLDNKITKPIKNTFRTKSIVDILKRISDNKLSSTDQNTFEMGVYINKTNNPHYIIKEVNNGNSAFILTAVNTQSNNP